MNPTRPEQDPLSQRANSCMLVPMGLLFVLVGASIVLMALGVIPIKMDSLHAPHWLLGLSGLFFFLIGGVVLLYDGVLIPQARQSRLYHWLQYLVTLGALGSFAIIFMWVGFGPGERKFEGSTSIGPFTTSGSGDELIGRLMFGGFGLLVALLTVSLVLGGLWRLLDLPPLGRTEKDDASE